LGEGGGREGREEERRVGVVAMEEREEERGRERERKVKWTEQEMAGVAGSNRSPC